MLALLKRVISISFSAFCVGLQLLLMVGCIFLPSRSRPKNTIEKPLFLTELKSLDEFRDLSISRDGSTFVRFTWDFKQQGQPFYFQRMLDGAGKERLHLSFLQEAFPARFPSTFTMADYERIAVNPQTQELITGPLYYAENVTIPEWSRSKALAFSMMLGSSDIDAAKISLTYEALKTAAPFEAEALIYVFDTLPAWLRNKDKLKILGIPSTFFSKIQAGVMPSQSATCNTASSFGFLKKISHEEFAKGDYSNKDILIFDNVPLDIGPVSGVISMTPVVPHSHVIFRAVNQKIPCLFLDKAVENPKITPLLGQLVRLKVGENGSFEVTGDFPAEEADRYFIDRVASLNLPPLRANLETKTLFHYSASSVVDPEIVTSYGAKGRNFALLDRALRNANFDRSFTNGGFLIPYSFYDMHLKQTLTANVCEKAIQKCSQTQGDLCLTLGSNCQALAGAGKTLTDFVFPLTTGRAANTLVQDGIRRKTTLEFIQVLIKKTKLPSQVSSTIQAALKQSFPSTTRIRFRSSTNAEDLPGLTGAGLYTSKSGCQADAENATAKSACMTSDELTRTQRRIEQLSKFNLPEVKAVISDLQESLTDKDPPEDGLRSVYASLWNERAYLFRDFYRLSHEKVFMGVLVHPSFADETSNGVLIVEKEESGRILGDVVAQVDEISVTNPEIPNAIPEQFRVSISSDGAQMTSPNYFSRSNQTSGLVLSDSQILQLMKQIAVVYNLFFALDSNSHKRLDVEVKTNKNGEVQIKQARPL